MNSRAQTDWGTVRTYMNIGFTSNTPDITRRTGAGCRYMRTAPLFSGRVSPSVGRSPSMTSSWSRSYTYFALYVPDTGDAVPTSPPTPRNGATASLRRFRSKVRAGMPL